MKEQLFYYAKKKDAELPPPRAFADILSRLSGTRIEAVWQNAHKTTGYLGMCALYEGSYQQYFDSNPQALEGVARYTDVYDVIPEDMEAGLDLDSSDKNGYIHVQDIIVRRCMSRAGLKFLDNDPANLLQIRTTSSSELGRSLSPFYVPFFRPTIIDHQNPIVTVSSKCLPGSVESYYHHNKRIRANDMSPAALQKLSTQAFGDALTIEPVDTDL